jgi:hypothetical protein
MPVSITTTKCFLQIFIQGYTGEGTAPVIPASGAYIFKPLFPEPLPVSLIRTM